MGGKIIEWQLFTVNDALAGKLDVGVHGAPTVGAELLHRQHLAGRLLAGAPAGFLLGVGIGTDQRCQVLEQQLVGHQLAGEFGPWLARGKRQVAVDVTVTYLAVEPLVVERRAFGRMQVGGQVAISLVGWGVWQGHPRQRIKVAQAGAGQAQAKVQRTQVARVGQGAGEYHMGIGNPHVGLQRERLAGVLQRQQATDLARAGNRLAFVAALGL